MTRDDMIRLAHEAGIRPISEFASLGAWIIYDEWLERFANLIAAAEREACARLCDELWRKGGWDHNAGYAADKIRARGLQNMNNAAEANGEIL